ncbi:MAG: hypothetical protein Q4D35_04595 [Ruminococcus sp.]|nr:hypothetical protein [Ruminococcus sp.]
MKNDYKKPHIWFNEFVTEDVINASITQSGSISVPSGTKNTIADIVTPDPWDDDNDNA